MAGERPCLTPAEAVGQVEEAQVIFRGLCARVGRLRSWRLSRGRRFKEMLAAERQSAVLYRGLAAGAQGERKEIFEQLAAVEDKHAAHWAAKLTELGESDPRPRPASSCSTRVLTWLAHRFSVDAVLPLVERAEHADAGLYQGDPDATPDMAIDERSHARVLTRLRGPAEEGGRGIAKRERWHRGDRSGALRAGVFGVNDGLVSNTSLVMGFAGSGAGRRHDRCSPAWPDCWPARSPWRPASTSPCAASARRTSGRSPSRRTNCARTRRRSRRSWR